MDIGDIGQALAALVQGDRAMLVALGLIALLLLAKLLALRPPRRVGGKAPRRWRRGGGKAEGAAALPGRPDIADPSTQLAAIAPIVSQ